MDVQETDDYDALKSALFEAFGVRTEPERFSAEVSGGNSNGVKACGCSLVTCAGSSRRRRARLERFHHAQGERVSSVKTDADREATAAPVKTRKEVGKELAELVRQLKELLMTDIPAAAKRAPPQQRMTPNRMPLWNVYHVETRTNNHLEGWHFKMNRQAGKRHLSFYELLRLLIDEQGSTETLIEQLRITALTAEYDGGTRTMEQFPKAIAYAVPEPVNF
ncbi:hypothetical protein T12_13203 [Trichinella patagoniensis]|uniref:Uncharacterized protein n=1 Tax=Trichinella patagoniensis TaxID=990121 RepID=A0A0V0Z6H1_9BILA|nr:hypothetical protein T12_13203 [Trichinella patagoniensis]